MLCLLSVCVSVCPLNIFGYFFIWCTRGSTATVCLLSVLRQYPTMVCSECVSSRRQFVCVHNMDVENIGFENVYLISTCHVSRRRPGNLRNIWSRLPLSDQHNLFIWPTNIIQFKWLPARYIINAFSSKDFNHFQKNQTHLWSFAEIFRHKQTLTVSMHMLIFWTKKYLFFNQDLVKSYKKSRFFTAFRLRSQKFTNWFRFQACKMF